MKKPGRKKQLLAALLFVLGVGLLIIPPEQTLSRTDDAFYLYWTGAMMFWLFALLLLASDSIYRSSAQIQTTAGTLPRRHLALRFLFFVFFVWRRQIGRASC